MLRNTELYAKCAPPYLPRAPAGRGIQKLLLAKLSQLRGVGLAVRSRVAPKSTGALAREFIVCPRFHGEAACQSRFRGRVDRSRYDVMPYPSLRRAPCRWTFQPTRAVNSCTVYSVVKFHESLKKFCFSLYRQRERANYDTLGKFSEFCLYRRKQ